MFRLTRQHPRRAFTAGLNVQDAVRIAEAITTSNAESTRAIHT